MAAITACRGCDGSRLVRVLDLGVTPFADRMLTRAQLEEPEPTAPLIVVLCEDCSLVQITETVAPEVLFHADYPYFSSVSDTLMRHTLENAEEIMRSRNLGPSSLVIELASNDGYMLKHFVARGIPVLGIDPAPGPAEAARKAGVATMCDFFGAELGRKLAAEGKRADVVIANNVLAHVADLGGFIDGIRTILADDGVAVIEVPYVRDLVDHCEFDTIYHQHLCYFSVTALDRTLARRGLVLQDVARIPIHGGSLRLRVGRTGIASDRLRALLGEEHALAADRIQYYARFAERVAALRANLRAILSDLKAHGARIAGYGAAAKATTLMSYCGIDASTLDYIVDRNQFKQGRFMPGNRLAVHPPETLLEDRPDYLLILAWNFADEIIAQQSEYRGGGGRFIVPVPEPRVV